MIYRSYWPLDEAHVLDGDADFAGVIAVGRPELLKAGFLADARNMRLDSRGGYGVRPAVRALRWATVNGQPLLDMRVLRAVRYMHPTTRSIKVLICLSSRLIYTMSPGEGFYSYGPLPGTGTIERVEFVQLPNGLVAFVVTNGVAQTYVFDHHGLTWSAPPSPMTPGNEPIPPARHGVYWQSRLFVLDGRDSPERRNTIWVGDFGFGREAYEGSSTYQSFRIYGSGDDEIVALHPFSDNRMLVFKRNSVHLLANVRGTNADLAASARSDLVTSAWGAIGPDSIVQHGVRVFVLSGTRRALMVLRVSDTGWVQPDEPPLSDPVNTWFEDINWARADHAVMTVHADRLYLSVPSARSQTNDTLLVYNLLTGQWESRDSLPVTGFFTYDTPTENGRLGMVLYLPEGDPRYSGGAAWFGSWGEFTSDEYPAGESPWWQEVPFTSQLTTRAYVVPDRMESRVVSLTWAEKGMDSRYRVQITSGSSVLERVNDVREASANGWVHPWNRPARDPTNANDDARDPDRVDWTEYPNGFLLKSGFKVSPRLRHEHWTVRSSPAVSHQVRFTVERGLPRFFGLRIWMRRAALRSTVTTPETT